MSRSIHLNAATAALLGVSALGPMTAAERARGRYMRDGTGHPGGGAQLTPDQLVKQVNDALEAVKKIAGEAEKEVKRIGEMSTETKGKADEALTKFNVLDELKNRVFDLEQKGSRPGGGGDGLEVKSYGQQVAEADGIKAVAKKERNSLRIELKAISSAAGSAGGLIVSQRETDIVDLPKRPDIIMRDLLTVVPITTSSVEYPKQSVRTNNAAPVPEGTPKPYSNYGWTRATANVRTIAHLAKLTRQAMDDAPRLQAEVDAEMRYGMALTEDGQILLGDGTGENLYGLMPQATAFLLPVGATAPATSIDKLRAALLQSILALYPADAFVLNPIDWYNIEISKDAQNRYLFANPLGMAGPVLWGKPVASTQSMTVGAFLVGAFKQAATLYDRLQPEVLISSENDKDFENNLLTMRCEERLGLAVKRPAALIKGPFANA
jgi:HK97 family phage major capsid protein